MSNGRIISVEQSIINNNILWRRYFPPKRLLTFNGLHGVISQKMVRFRTTAVRTSNPIIHSYFAGSTTFKG
jgi:hypothetical protein